MRKFGLIGGTGPAATVHYYQNILQSVMRERKDKHLPPLVIDSVDPVRIFSFVKSNDVAGLSAYLLEAVRNLHRAGAEAAAFTGMTPHCVFREVLSRSPIPLIHVMDGVADECCKCGLKKIGLIGSVKTMTSGFAVAPLIEKGLEVVVPGEEERETIQRITEEEIEFGLKTEGNFRRFVSLVSNFAVHAGLDAVVLANTDLPAYLGDYPLPFKTMDPVGFHVRKITSFILSE